MAQFEDSEMNHTNPLVRIEFLAVANKRYPRQETAREQKKLRCLGPFACKTLVIVRARAGLIK